MNNFKYDISAFGEVLIDFTYVGKSESDQKLFAQNAGGAPANVLVCASNLGSNTAFIGKAGCDMHGKFLKDTLINKNVNTDGFILDENYFTTLAFVDLDQNGDRTFSFARKPGADTMMNNDEINLNVVQNSKIFHVGSLSLTNNPSREATYYAIEKARESGVIISYDPNYRASLWQNEEIAKEYMQTIVPDIMKISDEETHLLTSHKDYINATNELIEKGVTIVVVTLGSKGAYIRTKNESAIVSGYETKVVDTTGAGDSFWGAFLSKIASSNKKVENITLSELKEYLKFANATASLCVGGYGAIPSMPSLEKVLEVIK